MKKRFKIIAAVLLAAMLLISAVPLSVSAAQTSQSVGAKSGSTGDCTWKLDNNGVLTISGSGKMANYTESGPWGHSVTSVVINNGVTYIGKKAFESCYSLTSVEISDSVKEIGNYAFANCEDLESMYIPESVVRIGAYAVGSLYDFSDDYYYYDRYFTVIGKRGSYAEEYAAENGLYFKENESDPVTGVTGDCTWALDKNGVLTISGNGEMGNFRFFYDDDYVIRHPWDDSKVKKVVIMSGVTGINDCAFALHYDLESVEISESVTYIGKKAFIHCSSLTSIDIPGSVTSVGEGAFFNCKKLTRIKLSGRLASVGERAFCNCESLTDIAFPDRLYCVGRDALYNTAWYEAQPDGIVWAGKVLYDYKGSCPDSLVIPDGTVSVASFALSESNLKNITFPDSLKYVGNCAFSGTKWLKAQPDGLVYAGKVAYVYKGDMPEYTSIDLKDDTLGIAENAFEDCCNLTEITIPEGVITIGQYAFLTCDNLDSVTIPKSVKLIGERALGYGFDEEYYWDYGDKESSYYSTRLTVYGYDGTAAEKYADKNGLTFVSLGPANSYGWRLDSGVLTIYGQGAMDDIEDYEYHPETDTYTYYQPWGKNFGKAVIEEGITRVGAASFHYCKSLSGVDLPESLKEIGDKAFNGCSALTGVVIPDGVENIGVSAFRGCNGLENVTIGSDVESIGDTAFYYCKNLKSVTIPESVTQIGEMAFGYISSSRKTEDFTIYGYKGTAAEAYATANGFKFVALNQQKIGDVNLDGDVNIKDVTEIQSYLAEFKELSAEQLVCADVDKDGDVTVSDATRLQMYLAEFDVVIG